MAHLATAETGRTADTREYYPLRSADVLAIVAFWAVLALISALSRELDPRIPGIPPRMISAVVTVTHLEYALWACLTIPIWWLSTRYSIEGGRRIGRLLLFLALGFVVAIVMDEILFQVREWLITPLGRMRRRPPLPLVGLGFLDDLLVYVAVLGTGIARDYFLRYRLRLQETARLQAQLTQARLDALRAQLNPHFLFNTLNAVSALVERDPRGARRMIARLSELLRYTLEESTDREVPLRRELDLIEEYVELMQIRFQGRLKVTFETDPRALDALVPNLILQPIVENAFKHGVAALTETGVIVIESRQAGDQLVITVRDNGPGPQTMPGDPGVGIANTNARLKEMYGKERGVTLRPAGDGGTEAEIRIPFHVAHD